MAFLGDRREQQGRVEAGIVDQAHRPDRSRGEQGLCRVQRSRIEHLGAYTPVAPLVGFAAQSLQPGSGAAHLQDASVAMI